MKTVILAAGIGSRLRPVTNEIPKALIVLANGKTILDYQIEKLSKFIPVDNIFVVVGYKKGMIVKKHPELNYVYNEAYAKTNTGKSLLKALNEIDDDVLWLNGDVFFDEQVIPKSIEVEDSCVLVDNKRCGKEEIKYITDAKGYIKRISKEVTSAEGEALGINLVRKKDLPIFKKHLNLIEDQDYFEKAIEDMIIQDNIKILPVDVNGLFCQEIDFPEDLENVKKYLSKHL